MISSLFSFGQDGNPFFCGTPDDGDHVVAESFIPAPWPPEGWIEYPNPSELIGPIHEYLETTSPGHVVLYSYPKFYRNNMVGFSEVNTHFVSSNDPDWDYEVLTGIWQLKVKQDGTFQAHHAGDTFTYRFQSLGIGRGKQYRPFVQGHPDFSQISVLGDTIRWSDVFDDVDISVRYIHDILKVDVLIKKEFMRKLRADIVAGYLDQNDFLTARFEIPSILITSQVHQGVQEIDPYAEKLNLNQQPLEFKKSGKTIHKLRLVETCVLDDQGDLLSLDSSILSEQTWYLKEGQSGIAEMSAQLSSLAEAPDGDVVIDPSLLFGSFNVATMDSYLLGNSFAKFGSSPNIYFYSGQPYRAVFTCDVSSLGASREIISAKLKIYSATNTTTSSAQFRACNITSTWWEACVNWFERDCGISWNTAGGDYTTTNSALTTIPAGLTGTHEIDLTAPFKARYPSGMSDITGKGFLILLENTPGGYINYYSKEYSNTALRWKMEITYAIVQNVTINPSDGKLYAPRQRTVTATINPPVAGVTVNFRVIDVDDPADNLTIDPNGSLGGDNYNDSYSLSVASAQTNASGQAQTVFTANNKYGGNNYVVEASVSGSAVNSPTMEVWRKLKIEYDAMADTPIGINDWGGNRSHIIHDNYLNGTQYGLQAIFSDNTYMYNRCTFIWPVVASSPPESKTTFQEFLHEGSSPKTLETYHIQFQSRNVYPNFEMLHMVVSHLYTGNPDVIGVGGIAEINGDRFNIFWDKVQYDVNTVDQGDYQKLFIIGHEIGHTFDHNHESTHSTVAGTADAMCIMIQPLNESGQLTKRFCPYGAKKLRMNSSTKLE
ncbi:MAG: DNRLRE domain-containing protein [bacterium]